MVNCPECGETMKIGAMQFGQPLYNCDKCGIDCYKPPKETKYPPKEDKTPLELDEERTTKKKTKKK
jgi:hypothetical protein